MEVLGCSPSLAGEARGHDDGLEGVTASGSCRAAPSLCGSFPDFLCRLGGEVGGAGEELGFAAAADAGTLQKLAVISLPLSVPPSLPSCPPASPRCGCHLSSPSLLSHNELVLIAPRASSAVGVTALISKLPSQGEQACLPAAAS